MDFTHHRSLCLAPVALFLFSLLGCEKRACFHWSAVEGTCPSADDSLKFFQNTSCINAIRSVDSAGDFEGDLCCYDVTAYDTGDELCTASSSNGGVGGSAGSGKPIPPAPSMFAVSVGGGNSGIGANGPTPDCALCFERLSGSFSAPLCPESQAVMDNLVNCECASSCSGTCCSDDLSNEPCLICRKEHPMECQAELNACMNDGAVDGGPPPP